MAAQETPPPVVGEGAAPTVAADDTAQEKIFSYVGFDLGSEHFVAAATPSTSVAPHIVRNSHAQESTPSAISYQGPKRLLGEAAAEQPAAQARNTVFRPFNMLGATKGCKVADSWISQSANVVCDGANGTLNVEMNVDAADEAKVTALPFEQVSSALLSTMAADAAKKDGTEATRLALVVPSCLGERHVRAVMDAAAIAKLPQDTTAVFGVSSALAQAYGFRHSKDIAAQAEEEIAAALEAKAEADKQKETEDANAKGETTTEGETAETPLPTATPRVVAIVDVGACFTTAVILSCTATTGTILGANSVANGAADIDALMVEHFVTEVREKHGQDAVTSVKEKTRLRKQVARLKTLLSTLDDAHTMAENLAGDVDVNLRLTRSTFDSMAQPVVESIVGALKTALADAGSPTNVHSLELVGGGARIPIIQKALGSVLPEVKQCFTLDSASSVAVGGSLLAAALDGGAAPLQDSEAAATDDVAKGNEKTAASGWLLDAAGRSQLASVEASQGLGESGIAAAVASEDELWAAHELVLLTHSRRNELEAFVFETRETLDHPKAHAELLHPEETRPLLDAMDEWLWTDEGYAADADTFKTKLDELREKVTSLNKEFYEKVQEERAAAEEAMRIEAAAAAAAGPREGKEDHDFRKLPFEDRFKLASKNKEEGNELFKAQNNGPAAERYIKALGHCEKFFDLDPERTKQVEALKFSCYSNLAAVYIRIEAWQKARDNCDKALALNPTHVRALWRRATAADKLRDYTASIKDCKAALEASPGDKDVEKLLALASKHLAKEKDGQKKVFGKMFS